MDPRVGTFKRERVYLFDRTTLYNGLKGPPIPTVKYNTELQRTQELKNRLLLEQVGIV